MRKFKSQNDVRKIQDQEDALWYGAGIPSYAWADLKAKPRFAPIMGGDDDPEVKVGVAVQEEWFPKIRKGEMLEEARLVYLATMSTNDELAHRFAYEVMKTALRKDYRVQITNAARIDKEEVEGETVFMLHNVFRDANAYRIQCMRDWITLHEDCFRIVVMTGVDPYQFGRMVHIQPHAAFLLDTPSKPQSTGPKRISR